MSIFARPKEKTMAHLSAAQRYTISQLKKQNYSLRRIGEVIGKDKSVISRELARNCDGRNGEYRCDLAQRKYEKRMSSKPKSRRFTSEIRNYVTEKLKEDLSPEQIVGRCRLLGMPCVSHESIYKYVWDDKKRGGELCRHLRRHGRKYRKRGTQYNSRGLIRDRMSIDERPVMVEGRTRFGDIEVDTIVGRNHKGAIFTAVDRATRMVWIELLEGKDAVPLKDAALSALSSVKGLIKTITADNGREFAAHKAIAEGLNVGFYFAHPYHSWERGTNENTNGLIRQYIPKGSSFENLTKDFIYQIQNKLNNRPRKILGYLTPIEYFNRIFAPENNKLKVAFIT